MNAPVSADTLDFRHLDRQTMGDSALRVEVLSLAISELDALLPQLQASAPADRAALAHRLKGAAGAIGAFALGAAAAALEAAPAEPAALAQVTRRAAELRPLLQSAAAG